MLKNNWLEIMKKGQSAFRQADFIKAVHFFLTATKMEEKRVEGWVNAGISQVEAALYEDAIKTLAYANDLNPNIAPVHIALGDANRYLGNVAATLDAYKRAITIERSPIALNKLACFYRSLELPKKSEPLYKEALSLMPEFSLALVNLATLQIDLQNFKEAKKQLDRLVRLALSPQEQAEIDSARISLDIYYQLQPSIETAMQEDNLEPLKKALTAIPDDMLGVDEEIIEGIRAYADFAKNTVLPIPDESLELPEDWPLIEALFMVPVVTTVGEYRELKEKIRNGELELTEELKASINMEDTISIARAGFPEFLNSPIDAEMRLRHWHLSFSKGIDSMIPGQFKMVRNLTGEDLKKRRVEPHLAIGTFRFFYQEIYLALPPGLLRGTVAMIAISDIHPFSDGNGRIAQTWFNRELELVGQIPPIFTKQTGFQGKLGGAIRACRANGGDLTEIIEVITDGQNFARNFCVEWAEQQK